MIVLNLTRRHDRIFKLTIMSFGLRLQDHIYCQVWITTCLGDEVPGFQISACDFCIPANCNGFILTGLHMQNSSHTLPESFRSLPKMLPNILITNYFSYKGFKKLIVTQPRISSRLTCYKREDGIAGFQNGMSGPNAGRRSQWMTGSAKTKQRR